MADDFLTVNVAVERADAVSLLSLYRRLIGLRREEPALSVGEYAPLPGGENLIAYVRKAGERRLVIVLNLGAKSQRFNLADLESDAILLLSTRLDRTRENLGDTLELRGDEGVIIELA